MTKATDNQTQIRKGTMSSPTGAIGVSPVIRVIPRLTSEGKEISHTAREAFETIPVIQTGPVGMSVSSPLLALTRNGRTAVYKNVDSAHAEEIVSSFEQGEFHDDAVTIAEHESDRVCPLTPDPLSSNLSGRTVLNRCGWVDPDSADDYEVTAGWLFQDIDPKEAFQRSVEIGVLGRGRGDGGTDEQVSKLWGSAQKADGSPVVVVNATES